jgi:hypothetical protein
MTFLRAVVAATIGVARLGTAQGASGDERDITAKYIKAE